MASIDKTYIDGKEYKYYRQWWIDNYDKMNKELGYAIYFYTFGIFDENNITPEFLKENTADLDYWSKCYDFAILNTRESEDKWLVKNCNIQSYRNRMLSVYNINWKGFKGVDWIPRKNKKQKYVR